MNFKSSPQIFRIPSNQSPTTGSLSSIPGTPKSGQQGYSSSPLFGPTRKIAKRSVSNLSSYNNNNDHSSSNSSSANILKSISELDTANVNKEINYSETNVRDNWHMLCLKVLPLFNGQGLNSYIEDLNEIVRRCLEEKSPDVITYDINELLKNGIYTINTKLIDINDNALVSRLVEVWTFFFDSVMPYFKGIFLPMKLNPKYQNIDVSRMAFTSFRDYVIMPKIERLEDVLNLQFSGQMPMDPQFNTISSRIIQMLSILNGILDERQQSIYNVLQILRANTNQ